MWKTGVAILLFSLLAVEAKSEKCETEPNRSTFIWSVRRNGTNEGPASFLFGTIHVAYDRVWDSVSPKLHNILQNIQTAVFELALHEPETIRRLIECKQMELGKTLRRYLPSAVFRRIAGYLKRYRSRLVVKNANDKSSENEELKQQLQKFDVLTDDWDRRRPIWLLFLLYQLADHGTLTSSGPKREAPMFDAFLAHHSQQLGKSVLSIETVAEQCSPLISLDHQQIVFAINYTISFLEWREKNPIIMSKPVTSSLEKLIHYYRCGNEKAGMVDDRDSAAHTEGFSMGNEADKYAKSLDQQLRTDVLEFRNIRMAARAIALLNSNSQRRFVFALGAAHFYGKNSIPQLLRRKGFIVTAVGVDDDLRSELQSDSAFRRFNELWIRGGGGVGFAVNTVTQNPPIPPHYIAPVDHVVDSHGSAHKFLQRLNNGIDATVIYFWFCGLAIVLVLLLSQRFGRQLAEANLAAVSASASGFQTPSGDGIYGRVPTRAYV